MRCTHKMFIRLVQHAEQSRSSTDRGFFYTSARARLYIAPMTKRQDDSCSARTPSSRVTPAPGWKVMRQRHRTLPPPPQTMPAKLRVCTDDEVGCSLPPRASMLSTVARERSISLAVVIDKPVSPLALDERIASSLEAFGRAERKGLGLGRSPSQALPLAAECCVARHDVLWHRQRVSQWVRRDGSQAPLTSPALRSSSSTWYSSSYPSSSGCPLVGSTSLLMNLSVQVNAPTAKSLGSLRVKDT